MNQINRISRILLRNLVNNNIRNNRRRFSAQNIGQEVDAGLAYKRRIFSGIQPTGSLHIGNYLGAVKQWIDLQNSGDDVMVSIVDLHSITMPQNPEVLRRNILEMTASLLACGIDAEKNILFLQSSVPKHAELCWIFNCISTMARLGRLPQFKEKSEHMKEVPLGLYVYPVLQAADIMLYKATHVPVGEDQLQHLQVAQQIAKTFNHKFGKTFPSPKALLGDNSCPRVKSLRDPSKKMSKSDPNTKSRILLTDTPDEIKMKLKKAVTDFTPEVTYNPEIRPGVSNMIDIHCLVADKIPEEISEEYEGVTTGRYKLLVADAVIEYLKPIRERINDYLSRPEYLVDVLENGARKAENRASITMEEVYDKIGIGIPSLAQIKRNTAQLSN